MPTTLITGANRGIGLGLARQLRSRKHEVVGTSRDLGDAQELSEVARVVQLDITDATSVAALRAVFASEGKTFDVLINNAGWAPQEWPQSLDDFDVETDLRTIEVNAIGSLRMMLAAKNLLAEGGTMVNISSRSGSIADAHKFEDPLYAASKAALNMLTRKFSFEPSFAGKCLVAVSPGWVRTRMGGPEAALSIDESTVALANLLERLSPADSGKFFSYDGQPIAW